MKTACRKRREGNHSAVVYYSNLTAYRSLLHSDEHVASVMDSLGVDAHPNDQLMHEE